MKLPILLKFVSVVFLSILVPSYWIYYGVANFLWFSDITLFLTVLAILFESQLLVSMAAVGGLFLETFWIVDFVATLIVGKSLSGLTEYMFDKTLPLWLRTLSLFHLVLPPLILWLLFRFGYDKRALFYQLTLAIVVVLITWLFTQPSENINWVYTYLRSPFFATKPLLYLLLECAIIAAIYLITHIFLTKIASD